MTELLHALGWPAGVWSGGRLVAFIALVTLGILAGGTVVAELLGVSVIAVQVAIWAAWLLWLGLVFPRNSLRDAGTPCALPYRRAFMREILFGIAVAFSQLLRPATTGLVADGAVAIPASWASVAGLSLVVAGIAIVGLGVSTLGVARTLFVHEYVPTNQPVTIAGIYCVLRHPLFVGGTVASLGLAICTGGQAAIALGVVNLLVLPIYVHLEDRRCCRTLGQAYADYRRAVGAVIPRRRAFITRSALAHQPLGSTGPRIGRRLARTK